MPRIRCHYLDCVFLDEGYCSAALVEVDPDTGCNTYSPNAEIGFRRRLGRRRRSRRVGGIEEEEGEEDDDIWTDEDEEEY